MFVFRTRNIQLTFSKCKPRGTSDGLNLAINVAAMLVPSCSPPCSAPVQKRFDSKRVRYNPHRWMRYVILRRKPLGLACENRGDNLRHLH